MIPPSKRPMRTCLGCRSVREQDQLVRYALSPGKEVLIDYRHKLPGRGTYTCIDRDCLSKAVKRGGFERAFKQGNCSASGENLTAELARQIRERILALLGMARKSGNALSGSGMVLAALGEGRCLALVLVAEDASAGIAEKVLGKARAREVPAWRMFDKQVFGQVMGKGERSVVAIKSGGLAETVKIELSRFEHIAGES